MISYALLVLGCVGVFLLPETLPPSDKLAQTPVLPTPKLGAEGSRILELTVRRLSESAKETAKSTRFIWRSRNISLLLFMFFVGNLGTQSLVVLILYAAEKWNISVGQVMKSHSQKPLTDSSLSRRSLSVYNRQQAWLLLLLCRRYSFSSKPLSRLERLLDLGVCLSTNRTLLACLTTSATAQKSIL